MSLSALLKDPVALERNLQDFASSKEAFEGGMSGLAYGNGLMTAVIAGPAPVSQIEWLPLLMSPSDTTLDGDDARLLLGMLLFEYGNIIKSLRSGARRYKPFFWKDGDGRLITRDWAEGFFAGMRLRETAWEQLRKDGAQGFFLMLAVLLQDEKIDAQLLEAGVDPKELFEAALETAHDYIQAFYGTREEGPASFRRLERKVGRNDPCPCGSGNKYKKCCLN
jgi:uncharacterized protein